MTNFFEISRSKIIFFIFFSFDALHYTIGKVIDTNCGDSMALCAPAPGAILHAIFGVILLPVKLILSPVYFLIWPISNYFNPLKNCKLNYSEGGIECYIGAIILLLLLLAIFYIYSCIIISILKKIKKSNFRRVQNTKYCNLH